METLHTDLDVMKQVMNIYIACIQAYSNSIHTLADQFGQLQEMQPFEVKELNRDIIISPPDGEAELCLTPENLQHINLLLAAEVRQLYAVEFIFMNIKKDMLDGAVERMQLFSKMLSDKNKAIIAGKQ